MKKLTAIFKDTTAVDLSSIIAHSIDFKLETIPETPQPKKHHYNKGMTQETCIMAHFTPSGLFDQSTVGRWLTQKNYNVTGAAAIVSKLSKLGYIQTIGRARYQFVKPHPDVMIEGNGA